MRWLFPAVVLAALAPAVAPIAPGQEGAQPSRPQQVGAEPIRPQPVSLSVLYYPSAGYYGAPGANYYPTMSTPHGSAPGSSSPLPAASSVSMPAFAPRPAPVVDAALYDDSFVPGTLYVAAGTVVRWTNRGGHHHTVTSDDGFWDSGELHPGEGYAVFFPVAGRYYYHC
jgi:plastocyanin